MQQATQKFPLGLKLRSFSSRLSRLCRGGKINPIFSRNQTISCNELVRACLTQKLKSLLVESYHRIPSLYCLQLMISPSHIVDSPTSERSDALKKRSRTFEHGRNPAWVQPSKDGEINQGGEVYQLRSLMELTLKGFRYCN